MIDCKEGMGSQVEASVTDVQLKLHPACTCDSIWRGGAIGMLQT